MWTLDEVIARLDEYHQRASYGAVAAVVGRSTPRGLMKGRDGGTANSWVVAKSTNRESGSRRGRPTGFTDAQLHPECRRQVRETPNDFIDDPDELRLWLGTRGDRAGG
jgi:hypothetical protein